MKTVAFLNQKGGVGKTSLCHHLAGALADLGQAVLLVDYDPQASLTQGLLGPDGARAIVADASAWAIAAGREADPLELAIGTCEGGILLVPGHRDLAEHNLACPFRRAGDDSALRDLLAAAEGALGVFGISAHPAVDALRAAIDPARAACRRDEPAAPGRLRAFLAEAALELGCDYCLIDCPPNLQALAAHAVGAAGHVAVPTQPEDYGAQGLFPVLEFVRQVREEANPFVELAGIVLNQRKARTSIHTTYEGHLRREYGDRVFEASIPDLVGYKEAIAARSPITRHDPKSNAAEAMRVLAAEFFERTGGDLP